MDPGPHSGGCPVALARYCPCFVNSTDVVSAAESPRGTIEVTCNKVNFLRNQDGTKSEGELLGNAFLFGVNVVEV